MIRERNYPIGAEIQAGEEVHFRVWAPDRNELNLILETESGVLTSEPMQAEENGYFSHLSKRATKGSLYRFSFGDQNVRFPDPASRFQPHGPKGPSKVMETEFPWSDDSWKGLTIDAQVIYEIHIGTFTQEGTFEAAAKKLKELAELGITAVEVMPLHDFPGRFGWGYDGVNLFAPCRLYGPPSDVKQFVDQAHRLGIGVILDVVYNHFGHEDNYLHMFASKYFNSDIKTPWGDAVNFEALPVREFFVSNVKYWIDEFHMDGLRFDATSCIFSGTGEHILAEMAASARKAAGERKIILIAESETQDTKLIKPRDEGGYGFDAIWNDDFHHAARVRLTGKREFYFKDYQGSPQEFISCLKHGFLYQGQLSSWKGEARGTPSLHLERKKMVIFLENHDQVGNTGFSERLLHGVDYGDFKALTTLLLLSPNTPLLFQGQEWGCKTPFYYFADHSEDLKILVDQGRREFMTKFPRMATREAQSNITNPSELLTFMQSKIENEAKYLPLLEMHKALIRLRKEDPVLRKMQERELDGSVIGKNAFLIRYFGEKEDRLLIVNLRPDFELNTPSDPLLSPGLQKEWKILFSTEAVLFGGQGTPPLASPFWTIQGHSALLLESVAKSLV